MAATGEPLSERDGLPFVAEYVLIDAVAAKRLRVLADADHCSMRAWVEQAIRAAWEQRTSDDARPDAPGRE